jgi:hypothetical protein
MEPLTNVHPWDMMLGGEVTHMSNTREFERPELTKEDFQEMVTEVIQDMADPHGDFQLLVKEGPLMVAEIRKFDTVMATKFEAIMTSMREFGEYCATKGEFLASTKTGG